MSTHLACASRHTRASRRTNRVTRILHNDIFDVTDFALLLARLPFNLHWQFPLTRRVTTATGRFSLFSAINHSLYSEICMPKRRRRGEFCSNKRNPWHIRRTEAFSLETHLRPLVWQTFLFLFVSRPLWHCAEPDSAFFISF